MSLKLVRFSDRDLGSDRVENCFRLKDCKYSLLGDTGAAPRPHPRDQSCRGPVGAALKARVSYRCRWEPRTKLRARVCTAANANQHFVARKALVPWVTFTYQPSPPPLHPRGPPAGQCIRRATVPPLGSLVLLAFHLSSCVSPSLPSFPPHHFFIPTQNSTKVCLSPVFNENRKPSSLGQRRSYTRILSEHFPSTHRYSPVIHYLRPVNASLRVARRE